MGYLTTVTIYNDCADQLKTNPNGLAEDLYNACLSVQRNRGKNYLSLGNCVNGVILQKPRHADDHTLYMHAGNTVIDVYEMEYHLKRLKNLVKEKQTNATS